MKLPRWLVVSLLSVSVLTVLGAGAWWWVTWPERTARELLVLVRDCRYQDAAAMFTPYRSIDGSETGVQTHLWPKPWLEPDGSSTMSDLVLGRRKFILGSDDEKGAYGLPFTVERGTLRVIE